MFNDKAGRICWIQKNDDNGSPVLRDKMGKKRLKALKRMRKGGNKEWTKAWNKPSLTLKQDKLANRQVKICL